MCAVSYREVSATVRAMDGDTTVVSLEPRSIEGILNTISTVGRVHRGRGRGGRAHRAPARAARGDREPRARAPAPGHPRTPRRRPRVARPAVRLGPLGPRDGAPRRWLGAARSGRGALGRDDMGARPPGRPGAAHPRALRVRRGPRGSRARGRDAARLVRRLDARSARAASSRSMAPGSSRDLGRASSRASRRSPSSSTPRASRVAARSARGSRSDRSGSAPHGRTEPSSPMPFRRALRLPLVRHGPRDPHAAGPRGLGLALPDLHRPCRRQRLPARAAADGARRALADGRGPGGCRHGRGARGADGGPMTGPTTTSTSAAAASRRARSRTLRGSWSSTR